MIGELRASYTFARGVGMVHKATFGIVLVTLILPLHPAWAQDAVGGALMGATTGALVGGIATGRGSGALVGAITGGTAGAIIGSQVEHRRGYFWRDGDCYRSERRGYVRVSRRYCY
jgi:uncharacterized protein YcfJ